MTKQEPICGIYMFINQITGNQYVGKSKDIIRRHKQHLCPKSHGTRELHDDVQKFGKQSFFTIILEECSESELSEREEYYIRKFKPFYNKSFGSGQKGLKATENAKRILSEKAKERWNRKSEEEKKAVIERLNRRGHTVGYHLSEETKRKIAEKHKGTRMSDEAKEKRRITNERKKQSGFVRENRKLRKPVVCTTTGEAFESVKSAANHFGIYPADISTVLSGRQKTTKGLHFEYAKGE